MYLLHNTQAIHKTPSCKNISGMYHLNDAREAKIQEEKNNRKEWNKFRRQFSKRVMAYLPIGSEKMSGKGRSFLYFQHFVLYGKSTQNVTNISLLNSTG